MSDFDLRKKELITKLNGMIKLWPERWIGYLLAEAEKMNPGVIKPPITDSKGRVFSELQQCHVVDISGKKALCGQGHYTGGLQLVSGKDFIKLPAASKCTKCEKSLKKNDGEDILAGDGAYTWLRNSQQELLQALFEKAGRKVGVWIDVDEDIIKRSKYIGRASLIQAAKSLERRRLVEQKLIGNRTQVRLTKNALGFIRQKDLI